MPTSAWLKSAALWLVILVLAIINGALREGVLGPAVGSFAALVLSGVMLSVSIFLVAFVAAPWYGPLTARHWVRVGWSWLLLTLAFEFAFGRFIQHQTWAELADAYTFKGGNLWPLVLVVTFVSPWLAARLRRLI